MNELNYGSLPACKALHEAGIVVETEKFWFCSAPPYCDEHWFIADADKGHGYKKYPAPSMAEVWRELPCYRNVNGFFQPFLVRVTDDSEPTIYSVFYSQEDERPVRPVPAVYQSTNPTDALIDLLIWVRKE